MKTLAFFNNKGGVGKTTLVYHLAYMFHEIGVPIVVMDLDPQANLTAALLSEERLTTLWGLPGSGPPQTILGAVQPLMEHMGDLRPPHVERVLEFGQMEIPLLAKPFGLVAGDLGLSAFEDNLAEAWGKSLSDNQHEARYGLKVLSAFYRAAKSAAAVLGAPLVLVDVGPSMGALNRAALLAADFVVVPMAADLFSLRGLYNVGPQLRRWRNEWNTRLALATPELRQELPVGRMQPIGYVVQPTGQEAGKPCKAYRAWLNRIPSVYREQILGFPPEERWQPRAAAGDTLLDDPYRLAMIKPYHSLIPLSHKARKPVFDLRAADGALGAHATAAASSRTDFEKLARQVAAACEIALPAPSSSVSSLPGPGEAL